MLALITGDMKVAEVIQRCPASVDIFLARGCPDMRSGFFGFMARIMSVRNAARVHKIELNPLLDDLNKAYRSSGNEPITHGEAMIFRIFRVRVHARLKGEFESKFHEISVPLVRSQPGLISVRIGKPTRWSPDEYVMVSTWENIDALEQFAGVDWDKPVIPKGMEKFVVRCWVHHYEEF